jgi:hypothetical protein
MDFDIEAFSIILVIFQMKLIFEHICVLSERKTCLDVFCEIE